MPKILLVNPKPGVADIISQDARLEVIEAWHQIDLAEETHEDHAGDPRLFDIVIHDCDDSDSRPSTAMIVSDEYLDEVEQNGAITVDLVHARDGYEIGHFRGDLEEQDGFQAPEIEPTDDAAAPFIEGFLSEHKRNFGQLILQHDGGRLGNSIRRALAKNQYGEVIIGSNDDDLRRLALPAIADDRARATMVRAFITRAVFAIHTHVLANSYTSARLETLESDLNQVAAEYREKSKHIETLMAAEHLFLAEHAPLMLHMDDVLKSQVAKTLEEVFGLKVVDLDEAYPQDKNSDLLISQGQIMLDVRGSRNRNANRADIEDVVDHGAQLRREGQPVDSMVLLFNGQLSVPIGDRQETFDRRMVREALDAGITLLTGSDLFERAVSFNLGDYAVEDLLRELSTAGRVSKMS